jgi:hypothetical protein
MTETRNISGIFESEIETTVKTVESLTEQVRALQRTMDETQKKLTEAEQVRLYWLGRADGLRALIDKAQGAADPTPGTTNVTAPEFAAVERPAPAAAPAAD